MKFLKNTFLVVAISTIFSSYAFADAEWSGYSFITELKFGGTDEGDGIFITLDSGSPHSCASGDFHMNSGDNGYEQISDLAKIAYLNGLKIDLRTGGCYTNQIGTSENLKRARIKK